MTDQGWAWGTEATAPATDEPSTTDGLNTTDGLSTTDELWTADEHGTTGELGRADEPGITDELRAADDLGAIDEHDGTEEIVVTPVSGVSTKVVTTAEFRAGLSRLLEHANHQPVTISSRGMRARPVLVSTDFYQRARDALWEQPYSRPPRTRIEEIMDDAMRFFRLG